MPTSKLTDDELFARLFDVFRSLGYEGASLSAISKASGLGRASLYHRFPGGKDEMAAAVLDHATAQFVSIVLEPVDAATSPERAAKRMARGLDEFYSSGARGCVIESMTLGGADPSLVERAAAATRAWLGAARAIAIDGGATPAVATRRAERVVASVQGSLILARVGGDAAPFKRALRELPDVLLGG